MRYEILTKPLDQYPLVISLDTEYTELNIRKASLLSISIGVSSELTYILEDFQLVRPFITSAERIYTWNGVVDYYMLRKCLGYTFQKHQMVDGMLLEHLIDERLDHGLGDYALREFQDNYKSDFWSEYLAYQDAPKEVAYEYEMRDGCYTYHAGDKYYNLLRSQEHEYETQSLIEHVHNLQWALFDTEVEGICVNRELMELTKFEMSQRIEGYLPQLRERFNGHCSTWELQKWCKEISLRKTDKGKLGVRRPTFSFASDTQLSWLVYQSLECPVLEKTKKGNPKVDVETIQELAKTRPELRLLADYKSEKSLYGTFVEGMLEQVDGNRIYPRFNVNGTTTGRLSHSNPNMANLPREGVIRNFFIPSDGNALVGADYSQLEVVVEANLTNDKQLLKIINEGASKHDITATGLGITRDQAKTLNFALQYGAGVHKVSKILGISYPDAKDVFDRYWVLYSGVKALKDSTAQRLERDGKITNAIGRTRHFDKPENEFEKARNERMAYNFLVQGVGADITNMATYLIADELKSKDLGRLLFSVHDEILCDVKQTSTSQAIDAIVMCMRRPNETLNFKYPVDCKPYGPLTCWSKT